MSQTAERKPDQPPSHSRYEYLDWIKGIAIMSVVALHLSSMQSLIAMWAPWHIWQAVPLFLLAAGVTGALSCKKYTGISGNLGWAKNREDLAAYYRGMPKKVLALYIPYAWVVVLYYMWSGETLGIELFFNTMLMGYLGPGGYFVPLIVQHLLFFPLILSFRATLGSDGKFLLFALAVSAALEALFSFTDVPSTRFAYRIFYFRYLFACCLGAVLAEGNPFGKIGFRLLGIMSVVYMALVAWLSDVSVIPPSFWNLFLIRADDWFFQHYPAFFYTAWVVFGARDHWPRIPLKRLIGAFGRSSYDIFIFQMLFFITVVLSLKQAMGWSDLPLALKPVAFACCIGGGLLLTRAKERWQAVMRPVKNKE